MGSSLIRSPAAVETTVNLTGTMAVLPVYESTVPVPRAKVPIGCKLPDTMVFAPLAAGVRFSTRTVVLARAVDDRASPGGYPAGGRYGQAGRGEQQRAQRLAAVDRPVSHGRPRSRPGPRRRRPPAPAEAASRPGGRPRAPAGSTGTAHRAPARPTPPASRRAAARPPR